MIRICFATNNQHKLYEVRAALPPEIEVLSLDEINCFEELPETSDTIEGNSLQKARYVNENFGIACFADDTGLEVESLSGAPGVYSARFAGPQKSSDDNIRLLLHQLNGNDNRRAQFKTVITLVGLTPRPEVFEGIVKGTITQARRGTAGFGYDPVFLPDGFNVTFAEMDLNQKNSLSHRGLAVQKLVAFLLDNKFHEG
jgi:XTP/dITP diphosphohydrolase